MRRQRKRESERLLGLIPLRWWWEVRSTPVEETDRETERVRETEEKDRGQAREEKRR